MAALERLLKLCSHFQVGGNDQVGSEGPCGCLNILLSSWLLGTRFLGAHQECERIYDQKERRLVRARWA